MYAQVLMNVCAMEFPMTDHYKRCAHPYVKLIRDGKHPVSLAKWLDQCNMFLMVSYLHAHHHACTTYLSMYLNTARLFAPMVSTSQHHTGSLSE